MDPESINTDPPLANITLQEDQRSPIVRSERNLKHDVSVDLSIGAAWSETECGGNNLTVEARISSGEEKVSWSEPVELRISWRSKVEPEDSIPNSFSNELLSRLEVFWVITRFEESGGAEVGDWRSNGSLDLVH